MAFKEIVLAIFSTQSSRCARYKHLGPITIQDKSQSRNGSNEQFDPTSKQKFLKMAEQSNRRGSVRREHADSSQEHRQLRKSSSMDSLYISTTITKPCVDSIINSVATILHSQMIEVSTQEVSAVLRSEPLARKVRVKPLAVLRIISGTNPCVACEGPRSGQRNP